MRRSPLLLILSCMCIAALGDESGRRWPVSQLTVEKEELMSLESSIGAMPYFDPSTTAVDCKLLVMPPERSVDYKAIVVSDLSFEDWARRRGPKLEFRYDRSERSSLDPNRSYPETHRSTPER